MWKPWSSINNNAVKPEDKDEQMSQVWDFCYNHFPSWKRFTEVRFNFIWLLFGINIALLACLIGLSVVG